MTAQCPLSVPVQHQEPLEFRGTAVSSQGGLLAPVVKLGEITLIRYMTGTWLPADYDSGVVINYLSKGS